VLEFEHPAKEPCAKIIGIWFWNTCVCVCIELSHPAPGPSRYKMQEKHGSGWHNDIQEGFRRLVFWARVASRSPERSDGPPSRKSTGRVWTSPSRKPTIYLRPRRPTRPRDNTGYSSLAWHVAGREGLIYFGSEDRAIAMFLTYGVWQIGYWT